MVNVAFLAFAGEAFGGCLMQLAMILQKLAHRQVESQQKRNRVEVSGSQRATDQSEEGYVDADVASRRVTSQS